MVGKAIGILDYSENEINQFEEENEIKLAETSFEEVWEWLENW